MAKKDFTQAAPSVYANIEASTQEVAKTRRTYTEAEAAEYLAEMKTGGRKGLKAERFNMAFAPDVSSYIKVISRVQGISLTQTVNSIIRQHMEEHADVYEEAKQFIEKLNSKPII